MASSPPRFTSSMLALMPDDGKRYEVIDGELYVSKQPHNDHQAVCTNGAWALVDWNRRARLGRVFIAPGLVFSEDADVVPDLAWASYQLLAEGQDAAGHFRVAPELVVEVLSPGDTNERRDREVKLALYSRRGVHEYWIIDWRRRQVELFRRQDQALRLVATLTEHDTIESPLLPGLVLPVAELFADLTPA